MTFCLVSIALALPVHGESDANSLRNKIVESIDQRVKLVSQIDLSYERNEAGFISHTQIFQHDDVSLLYHTVPEQGETSSIIYANFFNTHYAAQLKSRDGIKWAIERFALAGDPKYQEIKQSFKIDNYLIPYGINLTTVVGFEEGTLAAALKRVPADALKMEQNSEAGTVVLSGIPTPSDKLPEGALPICSVTVTTTAEAESFITDVGALISVPMGEGKPNSTVPLSVRMTDWATVEGLSMPQTVQHWGNRTPEQKPNIELKVNYDTEPFDTARCQLSYYGLPEPELPRSSWSIMIVAALMLAVGGWLFFRSR